MSASNRIARRAASALAAAALVVAGMPGSALAQRDPAYAAARSSGQIGEKTDGYLGVVAGGSPALRSMIEDLNIKRRAVYAGKAQSQHATVEEYAFTSGCLLIAQTQQGEKYQGPDGSWQTRGSGPAKRDPRCP